MRFMLIINTPNTRSFITSFQHKNVQMREKLRLSHEASVKAESDIKKEKKEALA